MQDLPAGGFYLLQIGLGVKGRQGSTEEIRKKAMEVREAAMGGQSFNQLAATHSDLPSAVDGGDIGVIKEDEMAPEMLKLLGVNKDGTINRAPFDSVKEEIFSRIQIEEQEKLYKSWVKELREEAYIKELL